MKNIFKVNGTFKLFPFIVSILIPLGISALISLMINNSLSLYNDIVKPKFYPPELVFGVVWPILYVLMGFACYRTFMKLKLEKKSSSAILLYIINLMLNFLWPIIFFYLRLYGIAWIELILLIIVLAIVIIKFFNIDKLSGIVLIPYFLWLLYALYLNISIWMLNEM